MLARSLSGFVLIAALSFPQQKSDFPGDYAGTLGPLHVKLHLIAASDGTMTGTVDSPDQGLTGLPCTDVHVNGQALSFSVPMVRGTWMGFIGANGTSLSGMWNQGSPMALNFTRIAAGSPATANTHAPLTASGDVKWDDYIFKFNRTGTMAQVFQGGKVVGSIITMNGDQQVIPLPGPDSDRLKKSFDDYKAFAARSHGTPSSAATTTGPLPGQPAGSVSDTTPPPAPEGGSATAPSSIGFDETTHTVTVPRPNGLVVTFVGEDVKIHNYQGGGYLLRHQKGSAGRLLESSILHPTRAGGGMAGGGIEFLREGGGLIYDSGMGGNNLQENRQVLMAKQLSQIAVDAVADVRKVPGHESFAPPGYNSLKEISQYRLRSDGSR